MHLISIESKNSAWSHTWKDISEKRMIVRVVNQRLPDYLMRSRSRFINLITMKFSDNVPKTKILMVSLLVWDQLPQSNSLELLPRNTKLSNSCWTLRHRSVSNIVTAKKKTPIDLKKINLFLQRKLSSF